MPELGGNGFVFCYRGHFASVPSHSKGRGARSMRAADMVETAGVSTYSWVEMGSFLLSEGILPPLPSLPKGRGARSMRAADLVETAGVSTYSGVEMGSFFLFCVSGAVGRNVTPFGIECVLCW